MLDGLGMAETTPGPLIMVVQFVGFLAAFRDPGGLDPWVAAVLGAVLVTWVTFVPSFLWIFLGAPYIERLRGHAALGGALTAITAAVVGVILNLAVWFALHVVFGRVRALERLRAEAGGAGAGVDRPRGGGADGGGAGGGVPAEVGDRGAAGDLGGAGGRLAISLGMTGICAILKRS